MTSATVPPEDVAALRAFNRFYTRRIGLLDEHLDRSPFTLPEARVLYELAHRDAPTAADLSRVLGMDRAQMSRILRRLTDDGLVTSEQGAAHAKHRPLSMTPAGRDAFGRLNASANEVAAALLGELAPDARARLVAGTRAVVSALEPEAVGARSVELRAPRPGDLGWITHRQAVLYASEYGWDATYEGLVAGILGDFVKAQDAARDQAWIADMDGAVVGSVFLVHTTDPAVGKLRLLYVDSAARGRGVGAALVDACIGRAREVGYRWLELWTNSVLVSARKIYVAAGFELVDEAPHRSFGHDLVGQTWRLRL
jgi:DNA-binding MarR family transcriptional regulator/GNAT superfamily N-acetyltransferase